jgi:hypothetical protein
MQAGFVQHFAGASPPLTTGTAQSKFDTAQLPEGLLLEPKQRLTYPKQTCKLNITPFPTSCSEYITFNHVDQSHIYITSRINYFNYTLLLILIL